MGDRWGAATDPCEPDPPVHPVTSTTPAGYDRAYYFPHSSVWPILAGSAVALYLHHRHLAQPSPLVLPVDLARRGDWAGPRRHGLGLRTRLPDASGLTRVTVLAAGPLAALFAVVLVAHCATASAGSLPAWLTHPILLFFADISYALYLWHGTIDHSLSLTFGGRGFANLAVGLVSAVIAIGGDRVASNQWGKRHYLRWKDRFAVAAEEVRHDSSRHLNA